MAVAGVLIGWVARGAESAAARRETTAARGKVPARNFGPSGVFGNRRMPSAADVLGALRAAPSGDLVRVEGNVVDAMSRAPVAGVEVVFVGPTGETTTDANADGAYSIDLSPGEYRAFVRGDHVISVGAAPFERLPTPPDPLAASAPDDQLAPLIEVNRSQRGVDLEVQRSGVVVGKVVDETGRPVVGAVVRVAVGIWRPVLGTHIAETGTDGAFRLEVPAGYYDLEAAHPDFAGPAGYGGQRPSVMVYPAMDTTQDITLARGCVITGRAIRRDGAPAGAGALERGNGVDFWPAAPLADDGTFRYTTVLEEEVTLRAWPWKSPPAPPRTLACNDGARHVVEFVVPDDAPDLTGRIVDASGNPAPMAYVDVYGLTPGTMNQQERADGSGEWAVYALPDGEYNITAYVPGQGVASAQVSVPGTDVALRLSGTGALRGRVDGVPDGSTFQLQIAGCVSAHGSVMMPPTIRVVPVFGGSYRVEGLPACDLVAHARSTSRMQSIQVEIGAGQDASFDLDLTPPRRKQVRVSVVDPSGIAVEGASVTVVHLDAPGAQSGDPETTDARGQATIEAHVGDLITVYSMTPDGMGRMGQHTVSDAAGSVEDAEIELVGGYFDP